MQKIYTKVINAWDEAQQKYITVEDESDFYYYDGALALCGGGGSEPQPTQTTTVQKSDPWEEQKPYLIRGFQEAQGLLNKPAPGYYPGNTVVPFSPETEAAMQMQTNRAINGSPIQESANDQLSKTLSGDYLSGALTQGRNTGLGALQSTANGDYLTGGAGFNAALDAASRKVLPMVDSAFEKSGRTGSGLAQVAKTQALGDAFAGQYAQERQNQLSAGTELGNQYNAERENQMRSIFGAPSITAQDYYDTSKLAEVGAQRESLSQEQIADQVARYNYGQNAGKNQIADYLSMIQGNYGGTSSSTSSAMTPQYRNQGAGIVGGALQGAMMFPANPALGAAGGGLLSMLNF